MGVGQSLSHRGDKKISIGAILQARCSSSRLYGKILFKLPFHGNINVLQHIIRRVSTSKMIEKLVIATSENKVDDQIKDLFPEIVFRGDEYHVLKRVFFAAKKYKLDTIVRLTGDNPCIDIFHIDEAVSKHIENDFDYSKTSGLPLGTNIEIVSFKALEEALREAKDDYDVEHVTPFFTKKPDRFKIDETKIEVSDSLKNLRLTLDYPSDYAMLNLVFMHFGDHVFSLEELGKFIENNPWIKEINQNYQKKYYKNKKQELKIATELLENAELHFAAKMMNQILSKKQSL